MSSPKWLTSLSMFILATLLFGAGFYFGYKNGSFYKSTQSPVVASSNSISQGVGQSISTQPVVAVYWIKSGNEPICPSTHPIKGTFDANNGWFYAPDNSRYNKIKPDICFSSEDFAKDTAGFVKKF